MNFLTTDFLEFSHPDFNCSGDRVSKNRFSLGIISDRSMPRKKVIDNANYFLLPHRSQYKLRLSNDRSTNCDAEVWIDGEKVGVWRIKPFGRITIERPAKIDRKFVFVSENSSDGHSAGIISGRSTNGIVKVVFKPERERELVYIDGDAYITNSNIRPCSFSNKEFSHNLNYMSQGQTMANYSFSPDKSNMSHGATTLGNQSDQWFDSVSPIYDVDTSNITTIIIRLMVDNDHYIDRPLVSLHDALGTHTTDYPHRLEQERWVPERWVPETWKTYF